MADLVLPPNVDETRRALLRKGIIFIEGEVNKEMFDRVAGQLLILEGIGSPDIEVRICSGGGKCHFGFAICDALKLYKGKKRGVVIEKAHSIASVILQACDVREMATHAQMLIHYPSVEISLTILEDRLRLKKHIAEMQWNRDRIVDLYLARAKASRQKILDRMKRDDEDQRGEKVSMNADEALVYGLIDKII